MLDHLGKALAVFAVGQGGQCVDVGQHEARLVERADEVFAGPGIDAGFAPDRAVDLGHDGRGNLHQRDTPLVNGGNEARQVADHPAAQGDNKGTAVESRFDHAVAQAFGRGEALRRFAGGHGETDGPDARRLEGVLHGCAVEGSDIFVRDDRTGAAQAAVARQFAGAGEEVGTDQHAALPAGNADRDFDGRGGFHAVAALPAATRAAPISPA